jgi:catalase (peroxidase I)
MVRLAWHDSGTYCAKSKTGGANGSSRFMPESGHGANAGLKVARDLLQPVKDRYPEISYADLYQLASVTAVEHAGGPKIPFKLGRVDVVEDACTPDGRLPDGTLGRAA